ncbi:lysis protein [Pseudomonas aestusnigri]|uniref:lysis protein n=1 Tax=Halopseudomonas aestusnigri TaxID=857252 RepID=UPI001D182711|nr:lysis protein [Halopseudomonas aestusnigri]MCC4260793.1 lysis protein [Halopseudomonas aestusnigri]
MVRVLISAVIALLVALGALWWQYDRKAEALGTVTAERDTANNVVSSLRTTMRLQRELMTDLAELDRKNTEALTNARKENSQLAVDVAAGRKRLRVNAACPAGVSEAASAASTPDDRTAELNPAARQTYHALRDQLVTTENALAGLQEWVREACSGGK